MSQVIVAPRVENPANATESVPNNGSAQIRLSKNATVNGQWITDAWSAPVRFVGSPLTFDLDPVPGIPYELYVTFRDGRGEKYERTEFRIITDQGSPTAWETFQLVAGPGAETIPVSAIESRLTALETALASVSGGATNVTGVSGISAYSRTYLDDTSGDAVLTTIGGAKDTLTVHLAGAETITGVKTHTVSPIVPTPTTATQAAPKGYVDSAVSGVVAGSVAWTGITGKPTTFPPTVPIAQADVTGLSTLATTVSSHTSSIAALTGGMVSVRETSPGVWPNRPVTPQIVVWIGSVAPSIGGTTTSATTAVDGTDLWWRTT